MMMKNQFRAHQVLFCIFLLAVAQAFAFSAATPASVKSFAFQPAKDDFQPNILDASRWIEALKRCSGLVFFGLGIKLLTAKQA